MTRIPVPPPGTEPPKPDMTVEKAREIRAKLNTFLDECGVYPRPSNEIDGVSDELIAILKEHIRKQKEDWFKKGKPQPVWLFPNLDGGWLDMMNVSQRHFHRCLTKAGLHHRRFHDLRHTFASLLLTKGAPIAYVSQQMGHASIHLTVNLYGHLQPGVNRHWMNSLPSLDSAPTTSTVAAE